MSKTKNKLKWKKHGEEIGRSYYDSPYWEAKHKGLFFRIEEHWQDELEIKHYFAFCYLEDPSDDDSICEYITDAEADKSWQVTPLNLAKQRCEDFLDAFTVKEIKSMAVEKIPDDCWWEDRLNDFYDETYMMVDSKGYLEYLFTESAKIADQYRKIWQRIDKYAQ